MGTVTLVIVADHPDAAPGFKISVKVAVDGEEASGSGGITADNPG